MEHWSDYMKRNRVSAETAIELLTRWQDEANTVGVFFIADARTAVMVRACVNRASNGSLEIRDAAGQSTRASFGLSGANFQYGPVQVFPRWPAPPMVWVTGLSIWLPSGSWLFVWDVKSEPAQRSLSAARN